MQKARYIIVTAPGFESMRGLAAEIARRGMPGGAQVIYDERNRLFRVRHGGEPYIVKAFRRPNAVNSLAYTTVRQSKARRSFDNALRLCALGIDTPRPAAYMEVRSGLRLRESYYICRDVASPQIRHWERRPDSAQMLDAFAADIVRLHAMGVWHKDFSPGNILVEGTCPPYRFYYIDLNRMCFSVSSRKKLMGMFGRMHDLEEPVRGLARCYGRALARWRLEDADASAPQFMHTLTEAEAERDAVGAYRRFWGRMARKRRLKRLLRRC